MKKKVAIALNSAWNVFNFRLGLVRELISCGYEVIVISPPDSYVNKVVASGCRYIPLTMDNKGTNPIRDLLLFSRFYFILKREKPDVFLGYTVKPNLYGSMAAHLLGIPVINNVAGLGSIFIKNNWMTCLVKKMYKISFLNSKKVFFQNHDDHNLFIKLGLVSKVITDCLPGSGINLKKFSVSNELLQSKKNSSSIKFLLVARMLWDKGIGEYVEAARILKVRYNYITFCLLGFLDVKNPSAISRAQMDKWVNEGVISYLGSVDDVRPHLMEASCVVLPSYREGVPRSLLEAAAMGCPIVTTDAVGCREVVDHGKNGFICQPRNAIDLADKLQMLITLTPDERFEMGRQGRLKVECEFDEQIVINKYLQAIRVVFNE